MKMKGVAGATLAWRGEAMRPPRRNGARRGAGAQRRPKLMAAACRPCRHRGIASSAPAPRARSGRDAPLRAIRFGTAPPSDSGAGTDRKSTRLNPVTNAHLVCRLLLEKKKTPDK